VLVAVAWCGFGCATVERGVAAGPAWWSNPSHAPSLADKHVVFVAGHLNEFIPGYFTDNAAVVQELGAGTSILAPPSVGSLDADVSLIEQELRARAGSKVVLFGHSRGGASVLLTVLRRPSLILSGQVEAVIVVQGALGGSPLADLIARVKVLKTPGLASLTTEEADRAFTIALTALANRLTPEEWDRFFARIFYVRSEHRRGQGGKVGAELAFTELALRGKGGNDGLLLSKDTRLGYGVDLGVLDVDHASLVVSSFMSVSTPEERRAFTSALFGEVGRQLAWPH
jgi:pimeloyl-ACP methyl ester carboxylesterase